MAGKKRYTDEERREKEKKKGRAWYLKNIEKSKLRSKQWSKDNPERKKALVDKWKLENRDYMKQKRSEKRKAHPAKYLYSSAKQTAKKRGLAFDLTVKWIEHRLRPGVCAATGIPFVFPETCSGEVSAWAPSLDQIRPKGGYTKRNIQVVCWMYNAAKGRWDEESVEVMAKAFLKARKKRLDAFQN